MSITPEVSAKTLTQLVATEIRVQMARADVRQSQLAREINKTEQWLSVRLRGRQPIDVNDLALIAKALGVGVHDLLPAPDVAARATTRGLTEQYSQVPVQSPVHTGRPRDNRPPSRPRPVPANTGGRTAYLDRDGRRRRGR